jgi:hypothetical protein
MGKVLKKVTKPIQKLIPKEIKPFLPALAAVFGPAAFAGTGIFSSAALASLPVGVQAAIASGLTSTLTEGKPDLKSAALSGIMAQAGSSLKGYGNAGSNIPLESATPKTFLQKAATATGEYLSPSSINTLVNNPSSMSLGDVGSALYSGAKASLPVSAYTGTEKLKEINEDELRRYNEQLRERGITDKIGRRKGIYDIYASIEDEGDDGKYRVYSDEYINSILDKYGYKNGGRIGFEAGGEVAALAEEVKRLQSENAELKSKSGLRETREGIDFATKGFEQAFGSPLMGQVPSPQRIVPGFGLMNGGRVNFEMGGNVSPTDSSEEGIAGVIYEDEDGNIISKKEAMDIFNKQAEEESNSRPLDREDILQFYSDAQTTTKILDKLLKDKKFKDPNDYTRIERIRNEYVDRKYDLDPTNYPDKKELMDAQKYFDKINVDTTGIDIKLNDIIMDQGSKEFGKLYNNGKIEYNSPEGIQIVADKLGIPFEKAKDIKNVFENRLVNVKANGGIIGLMGGGMPSMEMDYRGGGFIPVGAKEKADDVPARLSKNEFVMTADAVRAAGGGSVNEGARRMYELMNSLEARV